MELIEVETNTNTDTYIQNRTTGFLNIRHKRACNQYREIQTGKPDHSVSFNREPRQMCRQLHSPRVNHKIRTPHGEN